MYMLRVYVGRSKIKRGRRKIDREFGMINVH
jgi:hypothetical protein